MSGTASPPRVERVSDADRPAAATAFAAWLGVEADLGTTWPQMFGPRADTRHYGIAVAGELVAHAAARSVEFLTPEGARRVALIGGVGTAPEHRGRGLASTVLEAIHDDARRLGTDVAMLWSEQWDFYERLGYGLVGCQFEVELPIAASCVTAGVRTASATDRLAIWELHAAKPIGVRRSLSDFEIAMTTRPMTTMVLERDREVVAYACLGKGVDFVGWWHEVGGADDDIAELVLGASAELQSSDVTVLVPPYRPALAEALATRGGSVRQGAAGLGLSLCGGALPSLFADGLDSV